MIVIDVETAGLDYFKSSILSIGAVDMNNPENTFYGECRAFEGSFIEEESLAFNGFTKEQITDKSKQTDIDLVKKFIEWSNACDDRIVAGQNPVALDLTVLNEVAKKAKLQQVFGSRTSVFGYHSVDIHSVAQTVMIRLEKEIPLVHGRRIPRSGFTATFVGIPEEPRPHNALNGALYEAETLSRLLYGRNLLKQFENHPIPAYLLNANT